MSSTRFLTPEQQAKVQQFNEITNNQSNSEAVASLAAKNWCLERAINGYFAGEVHAQNRPLHHAADENLDASDDEEDYDHDASILSDNQDDDAEIGMMIDEDRVSNGSDSGTSLLPTNITTIQSALSAFETTFHTRYPSNPAISFFKEDIATALEAAFSRDHRPLVMYIHHERSVSANIFPSQVMTDQRVVEMLNEKFVLAPWDVTERSNSEILKMNLEASRLGSIKQEITRLEQNIENFPLLLVITKDRNAFKHTVIYPVLPVETVLSILEANYERYQEYRGGEDAKERSRKERQSIRDQQEREYQESLAKDMERINKKRREEEEAQKALDDAKRAQETEELRRSQMASLLPQEPSPSSDPEVLHVKFRLPEGAQAMRRFRRSEKLQILANFLSSLGFPESQFKYFNSEFPKKNILEKFDLEKTFGEVQGWPQREQVFVEEKYEEMEE